MLVEEVRLVRPWYKCWPDYVSKNLEYPENFPVYKFLEFSAEKYPENVSTIFFDKKTSYKDLWDKTQRLAAALHNLGVKHGDRVALYLPNSPQFVIAFFAINRLGAVVVAL